MRLDISSSDHGTSNITGSSNVRIRARLRHFRRARYLRLSVLCAVAALTLSCATLDAPPPNCTGSIARMSASLFRTDGSFWFSHAVVARGYHGWGIAPEEVLNLDSPGFHVMKLAVDIAPDCKGSRDLRRDAPEAAFIRISGRGRYVENGAYFELDCVCAIEGTSYTEAKGGFWQYL